jgi:hypothetical protein
MSLGDWNGLDEFLAGEEKEEWLHMVVQDKPGYIEEHEQALDQVQQYRDAYMMAYGIEHEHLINSETKYNTEGLV